MVGPTSKVSFNEILEVDLANALKMVLILVVELELLYTMCKDK